MTKRGLEKELRAGKFHLEEAGLGRDFDLEGNRSVGIRDNVE